MASPTLIVAPSPKAKLSYLALFSLRRRLFCTSAQKHDSSGPFYRSDFANQGFTGFYEPGGPTVGPLGDASSHGALRVTPKVLKKHLDQFVVGQERAKKVLSVAVYNHYQRVQELERIQDEHDAMVAQQARQELRYRHPVEDEFPGQHHTVNLYPPDSNLPDPPPEQPHQQQTPPYRAPIATHPPEPPLLDPAPLQIEKSNVLLLGPSGVGKTLMAKTLARVLEVPFSMSDCTPFTQAGYIGEDAEVCVQRLLAAANYDVTKAERGIICLDEIDKIATAKVSHGKDVSGEGVQQALLKIIEGTTVQVQAKQERSSGHSPPKNNATGGYTGTGPGGGGGTSGGAGGNVGTTPQQPNKGEVYNVQTDNILFICTGAFIGLHKNILDRLAKGSMGFGAKVRATPLAGDITDPTITGSDKDDEELFRKHVPFFTTNAPDAALSMDEMDEDIDLNRKRYNALDLVTPEDLRKFGLIPELIGRIPITCALSSLTTSALARVLSEPRNSLLQQYSQLFSLSGAELRFTSGALHEIAKTAQGMGTGARGLRTVMERLLGESMFEVPGSGIKHVLVTASVARKEEGPLCFVRGQQGKFHATIAAEEEEWERRKEEIRRRRNPESENVIPGIGGPVTFAEYREKAKIAGMG